MMTIHVEFFGVPRLRAGVASIAVLEERREATLAEVLTATCRQLPDFEEACVDQQQLRDGYVVSLAGQQFVRDPQTRILEGQAVLIMSADAGG